MPSANTRPDLRPHSRDRRRTVADPGGGGRYGALRYRRSDAGGCEELQAAGLDVTTWPVPDPATLERAVELAVDGITTDNPHVLTRSNV